jgi:hypothetical protein
MDNFRRGLTSHAGASAKTCLTVCCNESKFQNQFNSTGPFAGLLAENYGENKEKKLWSPLLK